MTVLHLALQVYHDIPVFSVLTMHKPKETFDFVVDVARKYDIKPKIYMVAEKVPPPFRENGIETTLLPTDEYYKNAERIKSETGKEIYYVV